MRVRRKIFIDDSEIEKTITFLTSKGYKENYDFSLEDAMEGNRTILVLHNKENSQILESYDEIAIYNFLTRMAMDRFSTTYDVIETFTGTIEEYKKHIKSKYDLDKYEVKECGFDSIRALDLRKI